MPRHPFQPLAAAVGVVLVALGLVVAMSCVERLHESPVVWFAAAAVVLGLGMIPWTRRPPAGTDGDHGT